MAQIERGEARIQRRISIKKALDAKVSRHGGVGADGCLLICTKFGRVHGVKYNLVFEVHKASELYFDGKKSYILTTLCIFLLSKAFFKLCTVAEIVLQEFIVAFDMHSSPEGCTELWNLF